jgi:hypothetical protein
MAEDETVSQTVNDKQLPFQTDAVKQELELSFAQCNLIKSSILKLIEVLQNQNQNQNQNNTDENDNKIQNQNKNENVNENDNQNENEFAVESSLQPQVSSLLPLLWNLNKAMEIITENIHRNKVIDEECIKSTTLDIEDVCELVAEVRCIINPWFELNYFQANNFFLTEFDNLFSASDMLLFYWSLLSLPSKS